ncbi:MAG: hypothetical protein N2327_08635 [Caldimicrobium sp.]|nr:hypothetical protein [Caldimicrobium sp.]MCX7874476.1 hypothetical protein [Caldimicrobium sp.]MDW8094087.1 hypothetical protein [Caldimicrobium sp.]
MRVKIPKSPLCPFCGSQIDKPTLLPLALCEHEAGTCECGAVYVLDATGFSRGSVFLEALVIACGEDMDLALSLIPEEDYREVWLENYDPFTHTIPGELYYEGRKIRGALCFIKLAQDLKELKTERLNKDLREWKNFKAVPVTLDSKFQRKLSRQELENLLRENSLKDALCFILAQPLNLQTLVKLLYHPEEIIRKKAVLLFGETAKNLISKDPERVFDLIRRLLYACADSASSPWGALEAVGEILRETGSKFKLFIKNLFGFLSAPEYTTYALQALKRIAEKNPSILKEGPYLRLLSLFEKSPPFHQALIIKIFTYLRSQELLSYKNKLKDDEVEIFDYENFIYQRISLRELWKTYQNLFNF